MKKLYVIAAMAALALVACTKNDLNTDDVNNGGNNTSVKGLVFNEIDGVKKVIELYNTSDAELSLEGVTIVKYDSSKEGGKSTTWTGAAGLKLASHSWIYLESSDLGDEAEGGNPDYAYQSGNHIFKGGLSPKKNVKLELLDSKEAVLDTFIRGEEGTGWNQEKLKEATNAFARVPDGTGEWVLAASTPGAANGEKLGDIE